MHYFYQVTVPKNTPSTAPHEEVLPLSYGVITHVLIYIPRGHAGLTTLKILYHEHQLYPLNPGGSYKGNETSIPFEDEQRITTAPYEVKAVCTNADDTYDHSFLIGIAVSRASALMEETTAAAMADYINLSGQVVEEI